MDSDGLSEVAEMEDLVWQECFPCILTDGQIDYTVEHFQSKEAMEHRVAEKGYRYAFIMDGNVRIGYTAILSYDDKLFLNKLYLLKGNRRKGYGIRSIRLITEIARNGGRDQYTSE